MKILPAILALAAGSTAIGIAAMKKKNICPLCEVKKLLSKTGVHVVTTKPYNNGVSLTPPMGWSSWNTFRNQINEDLIKETAVAMKKSGLLDAGYNFVNLDDCWHSSLRDENGKLQGDLTTFAHGMPALVKEINDLGFKVGIYSSNGTLTCEDLPASLGHERIDAETFVDWGIEYFKYDFCHNKPIPTNAPNVDKILIGGELLPDELVIEAENGELYGDAKMVNDDNGSYIIHLDSNLGAVKFSFVNVPKSGEYILTIVVRKALEKEKYLQVIINDNDKYHVYFPTTKAWSKEGRNQVKVHLNEGDNTIELKNPIVSKMDSAATQYINMGSELKRASRLYAEKNGTPEKPITFSICEWGVNRPWKWGGEAGNLWRTTPDINASWASIIAIYEVNIKLYNYAGVGSWNDPDMLEVGNGKLTVDENKAHFSLWCMMASPLILGNDIRKFIDADGNVDKNSKVLEIITKKALIDINQDAKGVQCRRLKTNAISDVLIKPLANGDVAVCLFNKAGDEKNMTVSMSDVVNQAYIDMKPSNKYEYTELWEDTTAVTSDVISSNVPSHGVRVFRVKAID
ncbi:MAG: alpha-galactosidase [Oscillospiraceae bacterium]